MTDTEPVPRNDPGIQAAARALAARDGHVYPFLTPEQQQPYLTTAHLAINVYESTPIP